MAEGSIHPQDLRLAGPDRINMPLARRERAMVGDASLGAELTVSMLAAECVRRLAKEDVYVEQTSDLDIAMRVIEQLDKPYLTDHMSPYKNDFFHGNCFWLILNDQHGQPGGLLGDRCDDSGRESLSAFSERKLRNLFPDERNIPVQRERLPRLADEISGRVVYSGDLFVNQSFRTTSRSVLRLITLLNHCLVFLKWPDMDWLYAFLRDRDVRRGASWLYHFPRCYPMAHSWTKPPSDQSGDNWLAGMSRVELLDLFTAYFTAPDRL